MVQFPAIALTRFSGVLTARPVAEIALLELIAKADRAIDVAAKLQQEWRALFASSAILRAEAKQLIHELCIVRAGRLRKGEP
jgi:hypothetical protein